MSNLSLKSKSILETCHPDLRVLFTEVAKRISIEALEGLRSSSRQKELVAAGRSKTLLSKHLSGDDGFSHAADVVPLPLDWKNTKRFHILADHVRAVAGELGIKIRWGGDWDGDGDTTDQTFNDLAHYELK